MIKWGLKRQVWVSSKKYAGYLVLCEHFEVKMNTDQVGGYLIWNFKEGVLVPWTWS